jgi:hypothetical protein
MGTKKLTIEEVNSRVSGRGIVLLGEYVNTSIKTLFQCSKGHTWKATPRNVMHGTGCPHCSGRIPLTKKIVNDRIADRGIVMRDEYVHQKAKALFQCSEGHTWKATPTNVLSGKGCPMCGRVTAANKKRLSANTLRDRLAGRDIVLLGEYVTCHTKTLFQCSQGHTWEATPNSVTRGNGCPHCAGNVPLTKEIVNARIVDLGITLLGDYMGANAKTLFQCGEGHTWEAPPSRIMQGGGCPHCDGQAPLSKEVVNDRIADRGLVMLGEYVNVDTKTLFQCSEGHTWEATPYHVMTRTGCPYCSGQAPLTTEIVNERIADRGLVLLDEFITNHVKVRFQCSEGHSWEARPNSVLNGRGCPVCSETTSDNDVFYLWTVGHQDLVKLQLGEYLLKHGVTSERLEDRRINQVANAWNTTPNVLALVKTLGPATRPERKAASIGQRLTSDYSHLDGWTEFRIVNETELAQLMAIAAEAAEYQIVWNNPVAHINEFRLV